MKFIKKAFTLAEVVMVMGIIGVVAMLTVTNATKSTDVAEKVAQLRRCDEIISAAFAQAVGEYGPLKNWDSTAGNYLTASEVWEIVSPYLKLQKNCGNGQGCWTNEKYGDIKKDTIRYRKNINTDTDMYKGILANGASIAVEGIGGAIYVDVNGKDKGTFRMGDDLFTFSYDRNDYTEIKPGHVTDMSRCIGDDESSDSGYCTSWVIRFGNQDYLKSCRDELSWEGKHSCKE